MMSSKLIWALILTDTLPLLLTQLLLEGKLKESIQGGFHLLDRKFQENQILTEMEKLQAFHTQQTMAVNCNLEEENA